MDVRGLHDHMAEATLIFDGEISLARQGYFVDIKLDTIEEKSKVIQFYESIDLQCGTGVRLGAKLMRS